MSSLKQEMREKYETHSAMAFYENNPGFEEGLLEKIINLAYASLAPYSHAKWDITAVRSPVLVQKLFRSVNDRRILDCAISLIICARGQTATASTVCEGHGRPFLHELELLSLSIGYAAKYYCIDYFTIKSFDPERVKRDLLLCKHIPAMIIGLGYFRNECAVPNSRNFYADTVRII